MYGDARIFNSVLRTVFWSIVFVAPTVGFIVLVSLILGQFIPNVPAFVIAMTLGLYCLGWSLRRFFDLYGLVGAKHMRKQLKKLGRDSAPFWPVRISAIENARKISDYLSVNRDARRSHDVTRLKRKNLYAVYIDGILEFWKHDPISFGPVGDLSLANAKRVLVLDRDLNSYGSRLKRELNIVMPGNASITVFVRHGDSPDSLERVVKSNLKG